LHGRVAQVALPFFYIPPTMLRLLLSLFLCVSFLACSSDESVESVALSQWFSDQGLAASYGKDAEEVDVDITTYEIGFDSSAYMVSSYAALGNANGVEQVLYFGLETTDYISFVWKLRRDELFYSDAIAVPRGPLSATIFWKKEKELEHDSAWFKKFETMFDDSAPITIENKNDTFFIKIPDNMPKMIEKTSDTLRLLVGIRLNHDNTILRIAPPLPSDIRGLLRVAQKPKLLDSDYCSKRCLHAGVMESLLVSIKIKDNEIKKKIASKTVVFAQLLFPQNNLHSSYLGHTERPLPVLVYGEKGMESYRTDPVYVAEHGHPNLIFGSDRDTLRLQVTRGLRDNVLDFALKLGTPMLLPKSLIFSNHYDGREYIQVFANRPAYVRYDFGVIDEAKLRLWFADYGDKK